jgi:hypothetical protein
MPFIGTPFTPDAAVPSFTYIPIVQDLAACDVQVAALAGISTLHGSTDTDEGRLYADVSLSGSTATLSIYSVPFLAPGTGDPDALVAQGSGELGSYFLLSEQNTSGISGRAIVNAVTASPSSLILIPTFATDPDVLLSADEVEALPGFDSGYGLAFLHALAMKQLIASDLPARLPHLFPTKSGLSAFVPGRPDARLTSITSLANPDQLRLAQASLVKALAAEQSEHQQEFADMAKAARARYTAILGEIVDANPKEDEEAAQDASNISITTSTYSRG